MQLRGQVQVSQQGAAGQRYAALGLTDTGSACKMFGYPGMQVRREPAEHADRRAAQALTER